MPTGPTVLIDLVGLCAGNDTLVMFGANVLLTGTGVATVADFSYFRRKGVVYLLTGLQVTRFIAQFIFSGAERLNGNGVGRRYLAGSRARIANTMPNLI
jgi:hypothetical protein